MVYKIKAKPNWHNYLDCSSTITTQQLKTMFVLLFLALLQCCHPNKKVASTTARTNQCTCYLGLIIQKWLTCLCKYADKQFL